MASPRSLSSPRATLAAAVLVAGIVAGGAHVALAQGAKPAAGAKPPAAKPTASATSAGAPPPDLIEGSEELQKLYMDGDAALKRNSYTEADLLFTKAWSMSKSFDVAGALGTTKLEEGKYREAAQYLSFAIRNALPSTKASTRERIKHDLDAAKQKLATIKLTVSLVEATVAIDGAPLDPLFFGPEIFVDPGKRTFEASAEGYLTAKQVVDTQAAQIYVVSLTLERKPPPGVPTATVTAPPPATTPFPAKVLGATGGGALIIGAVFIGIAEARKQDAGEIASKTRVDNLPSCPQKGLGPKPQCEQLQRAAADADIFGNMGIGFLVGGGALLLGAGAISLFFTPSTPLQSSSKLPSATNIAPIVSPNSGGVMVRGTF